MPGVKNKVSESTPGSVPFSETTLGKLRAVVGHRRLNTPVFRIVLERLSDEKILLQFRSDFRVWGVPGGHPEEDESIEACARRETFEETGLLPGALTPFGFSSSVPLEMLTYPNGDRIHSFALLFHATEWTGRAITANDETLALGYFAPHELPEGMLESDRATVGLFLEYRRTGKFQLG